MTSWVINFILWANDYTTFVYCIKKYKKKCVYEKHYNLYNRIRIGMFKYSPGKERHIIKTFNDR